MKDKSKYRSDLATYLQQYSYGISYNSEEDGILKHNLKEASHALDSTSVRVHKKKDGLLIINARGKSRYLTLKERVAYFLLGNNTEIEV